MIGNIMIIGPTGSGKTRIAYELARQHEGEIVNLDRAYLYRDFRIVTGLQDAIREQSVKRHLYELLDPAEPSFSSEEFAQMVDVTVGSVESSGKLAIAEGGSTQYIPSVLLANSQRGIFRHVIGIRSPMTDKLIERYKLRIDQAFEAGLAEEIAANMDVYQQSFLIKECHAAIPTMKYLKGAMTLRQAKTEILNRCLAYKTRQAALFESFPCVQWIDFSEIQQAVSAIENICFRK